MSFLSTLLANILGNDLSASGGSGSAAGSGGAPPAPPPTRGPLMLPRIVATFNSVWAKSGNSPGDNQKDVYIFEFGSVYDMIAGGTPSWIPCDLLPLGPSKTARMKLPLPNNFTLLSFFASASSNLRGGFRVNVYDINRRIRFTERPVNFNEIAGQGNSPLFIGGDWGANRYGAPYPFQPDDAQVMITIVNLETVPNNIEFGLYGIQGGHPASH
jgi:hypothetical protein